MFTQPPTIRQAYKHAHGNYGAMIRDPRFGQSAQGLGGPVQTYIPRQPGVQNSIPRRPRSPLASLLSSQ